MRQNKTYQERIEAAHEILKDNIQTIYHIPSKYSSLDHTLQHEGIRKTLLKVLNYMKDKEIIIYKRKYCFFLDNTRLTAIRGKTTKSVSNRYINYLCCLGVINKQYQSPEPGYITGINLGFMIAAEGKRAINTFYFRRYTDRELQRINDRAKLLTNKGITPGNISHDRLVAADLQELAQEVYFSNSNNPITRRKIALTSLLECIEQQIHENGYTTKQRIYNASSLKNQELDTLFKIFKEQIWQQYQYKAPDQNQVEQYKLQNRKWIIIKREG